jgi:hypothetical protein
MTKDITKQQWNKREKRVVARNLTSQHLTGILDNADDKRVAFFMMHNLRH